MSQPLEKFEIYYSVSGKDFLHHGSHIVEVHDGLSIEGVARLFKLYLQQNFHFDEVEIYSVRPLPTPKGVTNERRNHSLDDVAA